MNSKNMFPISILILVIIILSVILGIRRDGLEERFYYKGQEYLVRDNILYVLTSLKPNEFKEVYNKLFELGKIKCEDCIEQAILEIYTPPSINHLK